MAPAVDLRVSPDAADAIDAAAAYIATHCTDAVERRGVAHLALSGGATGAALAHALADRTMPWTAVEVWQVDERVAPDGHPERNATALVRALGSSGATLHLMEVAAVDLHATATAYAAALPRFDVVHLGLGADGHTASWPPDQPAVRTGPSKVTVTAPFNGRRRVTLTATAIADAGVVVWLVCGADKADALARVLAGDPALPGSYALDARSAFFADEPAAPSVRGRGGCGGRGGTGTRRAPRPPGQG